MHDEEKRWENDHGFLLCYSWVLFCKDVKTIVDDDDAESSGKRTKQETMQLEQK